MQYPPVTTCRPIFDTGDDTNNSRNTSDDEPEMNDNASTFSHLLNDPKLQEPLFQDSTVTVMQAKVMISSFALKYGLTNEALQLMLKIFLILLPRNSKLPQTVYVFKKLLPLQKIQCKFYCPKCQVTLPRSESGYSFICPCSETIHSVMQLVTENSYMFIFNLKDQLKTLLEDYDFGKYLRSHY